MCTALLQGLVVTGGVFLHRGHCVAGSVLCALLSPPSPLWAFLCVRWFWSFLVLWQRWGYKSAQFVVCEIHLYVSMQFL